MIGDTNTCESNVNDAVSVQFVDFCFCVMNVNVVVAVETDDVVLHFISCADIEFEGVSG